MLIFWCACEGYVPIVEDDRDYQGMNCPGVQSAQVYQALFAGYLSERERLVERRGDSPMRTADMTMTQMMYAPEKSKKAQAEKEARHPKRQPKRQASRQAGRAGKLGGQRLR